MSLIDASKQAGLKINIKRLSMLSRTRVGDVNYDNVDLDWYWDLFAPDYSHWERFSMGSFLNLLGPCRPALLQASIGLTSTALH
jgi:hypothetical protein